MSKVFVESCGWESFPRAIAKSKGSISIFLEMFAYGKRNQTNKYQSDNVVLGIKSAWRYNWHVCNDLKEHTGSDPETYLRPLCDQKRYWILHTKIVSHWERILTAPGFWQKLVYLRNLDFISGIWPPIFSIIFFGHTTVLHLRKNSKENQNSRAKTKKTFVKKNRETVIFFGR